VDEDAVTCLKCPIPVDDEERLGVLHAYGILDTDREAAFDRILFA